MSGSPDPERSFLICVNRGAGRGRAAARLERLLRSSDSLGPERVRVVEVRSVAECCDRLEDLRPGEIPVAAGGDGTVTLLVMALERAGESERAIGILPLGTGNILARELAIHRPRAALGALEGRTLCAVDIMRTTHPRAPVAIVSISVGFEARFIHRYDRLRRFGRPLGILAGLAAVRHGASCFELVVDGEELLGSGRLAFGAGLYGCGRYAVGGVMLPGAEVCDGFGDAAVYRSLGAYLATARVALGLDESAHPGEPEVIYRRWKEAELATDGPMQIDGEAVEGGRISVRLDAGAVKVLASPRVDSLARN